MELTITGNDKKRLAKVKDFAEKLGLNISSTKNELHNEQNSQKQKKAAEAMEKLTGIGAFQDIDDPVAWQQELRKDRDIGRDE
jgi:hypothetical protein